MEYLIALGVVAGMILILRIVDRLRAGRKTSECANNPEAKNVVSFDDDQISVRYGNGETRSIRWSDLNLVGIRTTDEGPFLEDVYWGLHLNAENPELIYPQGATGAQELLCEMQRRLPEFDNAKLIEAMGCTDNAFFLIWMRKNIGEQYAA
ncbi:MAG: hypothetical protein ACXWJD_05620 [Burkholderiaceae bacterium]